MKHMISFATSSLIATASKAAAYSGNVYGDGTTTGGNTVGDNIRTDFFDRAAIEVNRDAVIYAGFSDSKTQKANTGKTFRISRFLHILDDANVNNQGLDGNGDIIGNTSYVFRNVAYATQTAADNAKTAYDATAEGIEAKANGTEPLVIDITTGGGNLYGSSRNVGNVTSGMPTLAEGAQRVNRVGVTRQNFSATLVRRGNFIEYTDEETMFSDNNIQMEYRSKLGRLALEVRDDDVQVTMLGEAGLRTYSGLATSIATVGASQDAGATNENGRVSYNLVRKIVKNLGINKAMKNTSIINGSPKFGTTPINSAYYSIVGPDVKYDLEDIEEFKPVYEYAYANNLHEFEVGSLHEMRFIETNRAMKYEGGGAAVATDDLDQQNDGSNLDVFPIITPTKGSFASIGLQGKGKITFKSKAPGEATQQDPYGVLGLFSYNYFWAGLALQPEKLAVTYVTASA